MTSPQGSTMTPIDLFDQLIPAPSNEVASQSWNASRQQERISRANGQQCRRSIGAPAKR
jgi:hypothetical protein